MKCGCAPLADVAAGTAAAERSGHAASAALPRPPSAAAAAEGKAPRRPPALVPSLGQGCLHRQAIDTSHIHSTTGYLQGYNEYASEGSFLSRQWIGKQGISCFKLSRTVPMS